jgi:hypothetical protein
MQMLEKLVVNAFYSLEVARCGLDWTSSLSKQLYDA